MAIKLSSFNFIFGSKSKLSLLRCGKIFYVLIAGNLQINL